MMVFASFGDMGHHIDLRTCRIGTPDHHKIGFFHFARVDTGNSASTGKITGCRSIGTKCRKLPRIFTCVPQTID